jgi:ethanolamine ammonia-lyase small subunit
MTLPDAWQGLRRLTPARIAPGPGRRLAERLGATREEGGVDAVLVIADGLSGLAVERHAVPLAIRVTGELGRAGWRIGPVVIARFGRVALGDEIGERLGAGMVAVLVGERPGLSSPDSLGVYLTWAPRVGRTDASGTVSPTSGPRACRWIARRGSWSG